MQWSSPVPSLRRKKPSAVRDSGSDAPRPAPLLILEETPAPAERDPDAPNFDPRYRFETFVVGKANEVAAIRKAKN